MMYYEKYLFLDIYALVAQGIELFFLHLSGNSDDFTYLSSL